MTPNPSLDPPQASTTASFRVLVVEDSYHAASILNSILESLGVEVVGPVPSVRRAMATLKTTHPDAAVLDINLGNESVQPVAERLRELNIPFFFVSGYTSPRMLSAEFKSCVLLNKPVEPELVRREISRLRSA
ncbi:MAG: response regulator [Phycisphaerales bacterium]